MTILVFLWHQNQGGSLSLCSLKLCFVTPVWGKCVVLCPNFVPDLEEVPTSKFTQVLTCQDRLVSSELGMVKISYPLKKC